MIRLSLAVLSRLNCRRRRVTMLWGLFDTMVNRFNMNRRVSDRPAIYRRGGLTGPQVGKCQPQHRPGRAFTFGLVTGSD